jgi:hypothetical protein
LLLLLLLGLLLLLLLLGLPAAGGRPQWLLGLSWQQLVQPEPCR